MLVEVAEGASVVTVDVAETDGFDDAEAEGDGDVLGELVGGGSLETGA